MLEKNCPRQIYFSPKEDGNPKKVEFEICKTGLIPAGKTEKNSTEDSIGKDDKDYSLLGNGRRFTFGATGFRGEMIFEIPKDKEGNDRPTTVDSEGFRYPHPDLAVRHQAELRGNWPSYVDYLIT